MNITMKTTTVTPKITGFTTDTQPEDTLSIAIYGRDTTGKTRFIATAPDPIGILPLERKSRPTIDRIKREFGKVVLMPEQDFIRVSNPMKMATMTDDALKAYYRAHVDRVKMAGYALAASPDIRSIGIDSGTQLFEDMMFAHYGRVQRIMQRDYGAVYQEYSQFINSLSCKNLIITHHAKEVYKGDKIVPGKYKLAGYKFTGHIVNAVLEFLVDENTGEFQVNIERCHMNPEVQGPNGTADQTMLIGDAINFDMVALKIDPDWEEKCASAEARRTQKSYTKAVKAAQGA